MCHREGMTRSRVAKFSVLKRVLGVTDPDSIIELIIRATDEIEKKLHRDAVRASLGIDYKNLAPMSTRQNQLATDTKRSYVSIRGDTLEGLEELALILNNFSIPKDPAVETSVLMDGNSLFIELGDIAEVVSWPEPGRDIRTIQILTRDPDLCWIIKALKFDSENDFDRSYGIYYSRASEGRRHLRRVAVIWNCEAYIRVLGNELDDPYFLAQFGDTEGFGDRQAVIRVTQSTLFDLDQLSPMVRLFRSVDQLHGWGSVEHLNDSFRGEQQDHIYGLRRPYPLDPDNLSLKHGLDGS